MIFVMSFKTKLTLGLVGLILVASLVIGMSSVTVAGTVINWKYFWMSLAILVAAYRPLQAMVLLWLASTDRLPVPSELPQQPVPLTEINHERKGFRFNPFLLSRLQLGGILLACAAFQASEARLFINQSKTSEGRLVVESGLGGRRYWWVNPIQNDFGVYWRINGLPAIISPAIKCPFGITRPITWKPE